MTDTPSEPRDVVEVGRELLDLLDEIVDACSEPVDLDELRALSDRLAGLWVEIALLSGASIPEDVAALDLLARVRDAELTADVTLLDDPDLVRAKIRAAIEGGVEKLFAPPVETPDVRTLAEAYEAAAANAEGEQP